MGSMEIFQLVSLGTVALLIAFVTGRVAFDSGRKRGYVNGRRDGWMQRHDESTEEEREAWQQRTEKLMQKDRERKLAAYQAHMASLGKGVSPGAADVETES